MAHITIPQHDIEKRELMRVAYLAISETNYAVDEASMIGFCIGAGVRRHELSDWLRERLGDDFPKELPDNWLYARGL